MFSCGVFRHVFCTVRRSYISFVSFVQSPFKEALRDLSCSSDLSELALPREKGSASDKNLQKNSIREWLLLAPRHQPPSLNLGILQCQWYNKSPPNSFSISRIESEQWLRIWISVVKVQYSNIQNITLSPLHQPTKQSRKFPPLHCYPYRMAATLLSHIFFQNWIVTFFVHKLDCNKIEDTRKFSLFVISLLNIFPDC